MIVLRYATLSVCVYYLFLGKYMESKTQVSTGMMVQPVCKRLVEQLRTKYRKISSGLSGRTFGLKITITPNLKIVNFLDVTFNRCTGRYQPYKKQNDTPIYINVNSNHHPNIIKALPDSISQRISNISSDKATFNNAAPF